MSLISARGIHKAYGTQVLLKDASLTIEPGDRIGLLGVNGAGKSTLLKILALAEPIDDGVIDRGSNARILYLQQEPELDDMQTPREIVQSGLGDWWHAKEGYDAATAKASEGDHDALMEQARFGEEIERLGGWEREFLAEGMLQKLGVRELDRPVGGMSGGERRRVALARLLVAAPDLAILDEPTNHLDVETIEWLEGYLADEFKGSVILVTHDRYVLDAIATKILELEYGQLYEYAGAYSDYLEQKAERLAHEGRVEDNRQNFLRREKEWLSRGPKARSTKQKARIQRAHAAIAIEAPRAHGRVELAAAASRTGKTILELEKAGVRLDNGRQLFRDLDLSLVSGDRVGIVGPNGVGKTTLLKLVNGEIEATSGRAILGKNTKIAYFDQARAGLEDDWSIYDNVAGRLGAEATGGGMVEIGDLRLELRAYLERFLFEKPKQRQKVGALSGGERARVALAKLLRGGANLLLLDEPTNDLDVTTLGALEEMLGTWPGCALVVSHDRAFLDGIATSVLAFEESTTGAPPIRYAGGYTEWRERKAENEAAKRAEKAEKSGAPASKPGAGLSGSQSSPPKGPSVAPTKAAAGAKLPTKAKSAMPSMPGFSVADDTPRSKDTSAKAATPVASAKLKPLSYTEKIELDGLLDRIAGLETTVSTLEKELADPALWASRASEAPALQVRLDEAKANAAKLTTRWEELELRGSQKT